jgi:thiopurine S-methyltransferase
MKLNETFWDNRYKEKNTGWDIGYISTPLKTYFDQLTNKDLKILIPGGGNSYEAEYLFNKGFNNVYVVDFSKTALQNIHKRIPKFPKDHLLHSNFFDLNVSKNEGFDLIIEQTFFCALDPVLRAKYVSKMKSLLKPNGKLVGLLFSIPLYEDHPPFGGNKKEYQTYFKPYFTIKTMEKCYNSIPNRADEELFIKCIRK